MRGTPVDQPHGDTGVDRMEDRALALHPEEVSSLRALDHQSLRGACEEVRDDGVDRDPPAGDRNAGLAGRNENRLQPALARLEVELTCCGHLPDRAIRPDRQDDGRVDLQVLSCRRAQIGRWFAEVPQLDTMLSCKLRQPWNLVQANVQAVFEVESFLDTALEQVLPVTGKVTALGDDPDERGVRIEAKRFADGGHDRHAVLG